MTLRDAIERRYPINAGPVPAMRERLMAVCDEYLRNGHGDANAEQRLRSPDPNIYWQQLSKVLLAHQLATIGIAFSHQRVGPDFRIDDGGRRIWIEVITPTPANVPEAWRRPEGNGVRDFPHQEILLRWTAAIKAKAEVLLGDGNAAGYLASGIVAAEDAYVLAHNARLLRSHDGGFDALNGISQFPLSVEATMALGLLQVTVDRNTLEASEPEPEPEPEPEHQHRRLIYKPRGLPVPADAFLDAAFAPIGAIWALHIDLTALLGDPAGMVTLHNPAATIAVPLGFLPVHHEYAARELDRATYQLDRVEGRTAAPVEVSMEVDLPS